MDAKQRLAQFMNAVEESTSAEIEAAKAAAEAEAAALLEETSARCAAESAREVAAAKSKIAARYQKQMSQQGYRSKTAALAKRQTLLMQIFAKLRDRLIAFSQSEDYAPWMAGILKKHPPQENAVILLKESDMAMQDALEKAAGVRLRFRADKTIKLGGLSVLPPDSSRCENHTLDDAYQTQLRDFYRNHRIGGEA